jgi:hypothetical protein
MKTVLLFSLIISFIGISLQVTNLSVYLQPQEEMCLYEYFSDKTLVIYDLIFNVTEANVRIRDPDDKVLTEKEKVPNFKEAFTTFIGGYYEACFTNKDREHVAEVHFMLKHGVAAKDYSAVAKSKDLKPMELDVYFIYI